MTSSNQCVFVSKLFFRLLGTAIVVLMVGSLLHTRSATAASGDTYTENFVFENQLGKTIVPLPNGVWHKVHEEIEDQDAGSGDIVSNWTLQRFYLVQIDNNNVSGTIHIRTNKEFGGGRGIEPADFCYFKKWKYIKQESVSIRNTFCWGARNFKYFDEPKQDTVWERVVKKIDKAGWFSPFGLRGTNARYVRSDRDKYLGVSYYFVLSNRMSWKETRDWMRALKPRIQAGFQGKSLTPPKELVAVASQAQRNQKLGAAIIEGDTEKAKALLSAGADPNAEISFTRKRWNRGRESNTRVLVAAIVYRRSEIVYALLDRGVSFAEHDNAFAICPAVNSAQVEIVAALIKAGIDVNPSFTCIRRLTPLESAKRRLSRLS